MIWWEDVSEHVHQYLEVAYPELVFDYIVNDLLTEGIDWLQVSLPEEIELGHLSNQVDYQLRVKLGIILFGDD